MHRKNQEKSRILGINHVIRKEREKENRHVCMTYFSIVEHLGGNKEQKKIYIDSNCKNYF
jgi:hypothetical protein